MSILFESEFNRVSMLITGRGALMNVAGTLVSEFVSGLRINFFLSGDTIGDDAGNFVPLSHTVCSAISVFA